MKTHKVSSLGLLFSILTLLLAASPASAQTTETATTTTGGNWTAAGTWTCSPTLSPCVPNNGTPMGDTYNVGINSGDVLLNSSSTPTAVTIDSLTIDSLTLNSLGTLTGAHLQIQDAHTLNVAGNVTNSGGLSIDNAGAGGSTLSVGGNLTNSSSYMQIGNASMTSASTVNVAGSFDNGEDIHLNGGSANGAQALLNVSGAAPSTLIGEYYIFGNTGGAAVEFGSGGVTAIGSGATLILDGPNAFIETGATNSNSALTGLTTVANSAILAVIGGATATTTLTTIDGYLDTESGGTVITTPGNGDTLTNNNLVEVGPVDHPDSGEAGGTLTVNGNLANAGLIEISSSPMISASTVNVSGTLDNTGEISLFGAAGAQALLNVSGAAPSTLTGNISISSAFVDGGPAAIEFGSGGVTAIGSGATLFLGGPNSFIETGTTNSNSALSGLTTIANNSSLELEDGAMVTTNAGVDLTNSGELYVDEEEGGLGGSSLSVGGNLTNRGTMTVGGGDTGYGRVNVGGGLTNSGTMSVGVGNTGSGTVTVSANATNTGTVNIYAGSMLSVDGNLTNSGNLHVDGTLISPTVMINGGTLIGSGAILGSVTQTGGTFQPGDPPATLDITGNFNLSGTSYNELLGGSTPGTGFSVLNVNGDFSISSSLLSLEGLNGFTPTNGEVFDFANAGSITGQFTDNSLAFAGGTFDVTYLTSGCAAGYTDCIDLTWQSPPTSGTPEPASLLLFGTGLLGLGLLLARKKAFGSHL